MSIEKGKKIALVLMLTTIAVAIFFALFLYVKERYIVENKIAIIEIKGGITEEEKGFEVANPEAIRKLLEKAESDDKVKAIVLRINSPGGDVGASWDTYRAVKRINKPVVASISDIGASGAYLVAVASDVIVATPMSVVGSIGASVEFPFDVPLNTSEEPEKISSLGSGEFKDIFADYRLSESERRYLEKRLANIVYVFSKCVAEDRNMSVENVTKLAHGGWFTGDEALHLGLIDKLGNLDDALEEAARLSNVSLSDTKVVTFWIKDGRVEKRKHGLNSQLLPHL